MAENAEDITEGGCCTGCGTYFEESHGFPVLCVGCWDDWEPAERRAAGIQKATETEL